MKVLEDAKKDYEDIPIPQELSERIMMEVKKADKRRKKQMIKRISRYGMTAAASLTILFTVGLNTSVAFANAAENIPVIGAMAKVLTFRSYQTKTDDLNMTVDIPSIDMISEEFSDVEDSVNSEIYELCRQYANEAEKRAEEYRTAFLDTGGTLEEWEAHNIEIKVWYEVKTQTDKYLSLVINGAENWNNAGGKSKYYNFDLEKGGLLTLRDVMGNDYGQMIEEQIRSQMKERETTQGIKYFEGELPELSDDTKFYMNESGNPVIVFEPYEIAPGADGQQEFEITINEGKPKV